ncbi:S41 family peptidase [Solimonas terrae]|uniref:Peptidase n=1 Tax=Solimonas terrae TaxID=1396819 RepID=A0A6M2BPT5_9GAMM|nr:S41 family peptidase [Solimonas terrae]NGY04596.1 peptidase [Solimonas terrae]
MDTTRYLPGGLRARTLSAIVMLLTFSACSHNDSPFDDRVGDASQYAAQCALPRSGTDPYDNNQPYPDRQGTIADERNWLYAYMDAIYLWYREIPDVDASHYTVANYGSVPDAMDAYFEALKTPKLTASGKREDAFSFTYPTDQWEALSQGGVAVGYGTQFAVLASTPPRDVRIAYTDPGTPAAAANVARGAVIQAIDGVDINTSTSAGIDTLNAGLSPQTEGETHSFTIQDLGSSTSRTVVLQAQQVTETPVQNVQAISTPSGTVGYMLFNDHIATAEGELINAVQQLKAADIGDLVLDIRYNGGGYLDIASELAYMIAGPSRTSGKAFERLSYNDKNPLGSSSDATTSFHSTAVGFDPSVSRGSALPYLGLSRVFVLAGPGTCSASEAVVNGLRGVDVDVVLIGGTTCGKPYGFYPTDNCGLTYFAIEFQGVNAKGFGDYADGFTPQCGVDDDFTHALGDTQESLFSAALAYRSSGSCPSSAKLANARPPLSLLRSPLRENLIVKPPR